MRRVILITGGSSGIGKACAKLFSASGDKVYILARDEGKLKAACNSIQGDVKYICGDITKPKQCHSVVEEVVANEGRLDVVVNCAGVSVASASVDVSEEIWNTIIDTNLKGTFFVSQAAIPYLTESKGCIVNISSDSGVAGNKNLAAYCASKGGVNMLTKSMALELAAQGIRVNAVCPTETDTPMLERDALEYGYASREEYEQEIKNIFPQQDDARFVRPDEVAEAVAFLSDSKKAAAITGTTLMVDFGMTAGY